MKALTIYQPYATFLALHLKGYETRSRISHHRGELAIHAAATREMEQDDWDLVQAMREVTGAELPPDVFPLGVITAVVDMRDCLKMVDDAPIGSTGLIQINRVSSRELKVGHWEPGRFAYEVDQAQSLLHDPIPAVGRQQFWNLPDEVEALVRERLAT
ncbi:MAG: hypothetical protein AAGF24_00055 [Cyanobacteria bacterium P01_H01_bin.121]